MTCTAEQLETMRKAAPDMLEALENLAGILSSIHEGPDLIGVYKVHYDIDDIVEANKAIAKAKGENQ